MYCPEHIIANNRIFMATMYGDADIPKRYVPINWWLNPFRYSITLRPKFWAKQGPQFTINNDGRWNRAVSNFVYKNIKRRMCQWLGIHQRYKFRGGDKYCHHCTKGSTDSINNGHSNNASTE